MGPIAGIMICDYFFIRTTKRSLYSLYHREGIYHYTRGINPRAVVALVLGVVVALIGLFVPSLHFLYDYSWFVGLFLAGFAYAAMMYLWPVPISEPDLATL
jgi:NCS1 family nucleobase:cation symporter-1